MKQLDIYSKELICDLVDDSRCLLSCDIDVDSSLRQELTVVNFESEFSNSTRIDLITGKYHYTTPFYEKGKFVFELETKDSVYILRATSM